MKSTSILLMLLIAAPALLVAKKSTSEESDAIIGLRGQELIPAVFASEPATDEPMTPQPEKQVTASEPEVKESGSLLLNMAPTKAVSATEEAEVEPAQESETPKRRLLLTPAN